MYIVRIPYSTRHIGRVARHIGHLSATRASCIFPAMSIFYVYLLLLSADNVPVFQGPSTAPLVYPTREACEAAAVAAPDAHCVKVGLTKSL